MRKIALFIDIDNTALTVEQFDNVIDQIFNSGSVLYGKIYGAVDRKHKEIIEFAQSKGFDMAPVMRVKKRGSRVLDPRVLLDALEMTVTNNNIDAVAIVCAPGDMVPLFAKLREYGVYIMANGDLDEESLYFVDETINLEGIREQDEISLIDDLTDDFFENADDSFPYVSRRREEPAEVEEEEPVEEQEAPQEQSAEEDNANEPAEVEEEEPEEEQEAPQEQSAEEDNANEPAEVEEEEPEEEQEAPQEQSAEEDNANEPAEEEEEEPEEEQETPQEQSAEEENVHEPAENKEEEPEVPAEQAEAEEGRSDDRENQGEEEAPIILDDDMEDVETMDLLKNVQRMLAELKEQGRMDDEEEEEDDE